MASRFGLWNIPAHNFKNLEFIPLTHVRSAVQFRDTGGGLGRRDLGILSSGRGMPMCMHFEFSLAK